MSSKELKKIVYLVRHGQSDDNAAPVFQAYDSPLSTKGKTQAERVASRVGDIDFDALISSPQERAKQTAEAIALKTGKRADICDLFVERFKPTSLNGKSYDDPQARITWREWEESLLDSSHKIEDGENYNDMIARADKALDYLRDRDEKSLVVVSHGHFIRTLVARVLLGPEITPVTLKRIYDLMSIENTGITVLHFRDAYEEPVCWRVWSFNDHAHFAE